MKQKSYQNTGVFATVAALFSSALLALLWHLGAPVPLFVTLLPIILLGAFYITCVAFVLVRLARKPVVTDKEPRECPKCKSRALKTVDIDATESTIISCGIDCMKCGAHVAQYQQGFYIYL